MRVRSNVITLEELPEHTAGEAAGTVVNDDLVNALNAVNKIVTDLSTPNLAQAKLDAEALRNLMITLAQDCSP